MALRAKMILLAAAVSADRQEGHENRSIAATVGTSRQTVGLWRQRFAAHRLALPAGRQVRTSLQDRLYEAIACRSIPE